MKKIILLVALSTMILISCNSNSTNSPLNNNQIFPLKIGNSWITKTTTFDSTNHPTNITYDSLVVIKDTVINNETVYVIQSNVTGFTPFNMYAINRTDGFYVLSIVNDTINHTSSVSYFLDYKFPANVGDTYLNGNDTMKVQSVNSPINEINITFNCYAYFNEKHINGAYFKQNVYLAPGIGLIYNEHYWQDIGGTLYMTSKTEIQSYTIK